MTEQGNPKDSMIPNGGIPETVLPTRRIFDNGNIDELRSLVSEDLNPGDLITGLKVWADVTQVIDLFIYKIVTTNDPNPDTKHAMQNTVDIEKAIKTRDENKGFIGKSHGFEITILPTDLSFSGKLKNRQRDPNLAVTFELRRLITSSTFKKGDQAVSDACTVSLTDEGITPELDAYEEEVGKIHQYKGSISIKGIDSKALDAINATRSSASSFGKSISKGRRATGPKNPL